MVKVTKTASNYLAYEMEFETNQHRSKSVRRISSLLIKKKKENREHREKVLWFQFDPDRWRYGRKFFQKSYFQRYLVQIWYKYYML